MESAEEGHENGANAYGVGESAENAARTNTVTACTRAHGIGCVSATVRAEPTWSGVEVVAPRLDPWVLVSQTEARTTCGVW